MASQMFQVGTIIVFKDEKYKIIRKIDNNFWQIENKRTKRIHEITIAKMQKYYIKRELSFESESLGNLIKRRRNGDAFINEKEYQKAKDRLFYINKILTIPNSQKLVKKKLDEIVFENPEKPSPPSVSTLLRLKKKYLDSGKDITSLIPRHGSKGNRVERYSRTITDLVDDAIQEKYMCLERGTVQDVLDEVRAKIIVINRTKLKNEKLEAPNRSFIKRKINKIPQFDKVSARYGYVAAMHRFRSSKVVPVVEMPLERVEIDHTKLDIVVIDEEMGIVLGRPWLTVCIDVYSRSVLGIYIGFDSPSYLTVSYCLKHALLPKSELHNNGVEIENSWVQHGVMKELVVDNGMEFHSESLENACYSLGIEIHYSARKTPWFKGKVERFIRELNLGVPHKSPGTTFSNIDEKGEYDPKKHAAVRFSMLRPIIEKWIVDVYHQKIHSSIQMSPEKKWKHGISDDQVPLPDDLDYLDVTLSKSDTRTLTHKGIEYDRIFYNSEELSSLRKSKGENIKVDIRVDDSDIGQILVISPETGKVLRAHAHCPKYASGTSRFQHGVLKKYTVNQERENTSDSWVLAKHEISNLIKQELAEGKKLKTHARIAKFKEHGLADTEMHQQNIEVESVDKVDEVDKEELYGNNAVTDSGLSFNVVKRKGKSKNE